MIESSCFKFLFLLYPLLISSILRLQLNFSSYILLYCACDFLKHAGLIQLCPSQMFFVLFYRFRRRLQSAAHAPRLFFSRARGNSRRSQTGIPYGGNGSECSHWRGRCDAFETVQYRQWSVVFFLSRSVQRIFRHIQSGSTFT